MNLDNLKSMSREQLVQLAITQGLSPHHKAKPETIIQQIIDKAFVPQAPQTEAVDPRLTKTPHVAVFNTPEEVEAMVADIKARQPKFTTQYNDEERTVKFSCNGAEQTHNLSVPLRWLKVKATEVSRGRAALMGLNDQFDKLPVSGNNGYTNTVLAG
jgi:hypothetical protein